VCGVDGVDGVVDVVDVVGVVGVGGVVVVVVGGVDDVGGGVVCLTFCGGDEGGGCLRMCVEHRDGWYATGVGSEISQEKSRIVQGGRGVAGMPGSAGGQGWLRRRYSVIDQVRYDDRSRSLGQADWHCGFGHCGVHGSGIHTGLEHDYIHKYVTRTEYQDAVVLHMVVM
jgi:hypothetical protein